MSDFALSIILGIALAAAAGFRVFLPMLIVSGAAYTGHLSLNEFGVRAEQAAIPAVGFLSSLSAAALTGPVAAFRDGLQSAGYTEGKNVEIEFRWADGRYDRLPALATDLVRRQVESL
jgi:hypothetical protein